MKNIENLAKIELHDHLDGGVRPETLLELARSRGMSLPFHDHESLKTYLATARKGSLEKYLSVFGYTVPAMKSYQATVRVAREAVEDWKAQNIVYGEIRMAPELLEPELSLEEAIEAMLEGLAQGEASTGTKARLIVCAMRSGPNGERVARSAVKYQGKGVVGFDIAGKENGFPAKPFAGAFRIAAEGGLGLTVHAGEADGHGSVYQAVYDCQAWRIGHGVHLHDAWERLPDGSWRLDDLSLLMKERGIGIEACLSSNIQTGAVDDLATHPATDYLNLGFRVNLNTDNRLVSTCTLGDEIQTAGSVLGWNPSQVVRSQEHAMAMAFDKSAFTGDFATGIRQNWKEWLDSQ